MAYINGLSMQVILTTKKPWDDIARYCKLGGSPDCEKRYIPKYPKNPQVTSYFEEPPNTPNMAIQVHSLFHWSGSSDS